VIHHFEYVDDASGKVYPSDQPESVVAHIEYNAIPHAVGRSERLPELGVVGPCGFLSDFVPAGKVTLSDDGVGFSGLPKIDQPRLRDDSHAAPIL
jgi:hypothetical protein